MPQPSTPSRDALIPAGRTDTNTAAVLRLARLAVAELETLDGPALPGRIQALAREVGWTREELCATLHLALGGAEEDSTAAVLRHLGRASCIERLDAAIDLLGSPENPILGARRHSP